MRTGEPDRQADDAGFQQAWEGIRADPDIQFTPLPDAAPAEISPFWRAVLDFLQWLGDAIFGPIVAAGDALGLTTRGMVIALAVLIAIALAVVAWRWFRRRAQAPGDPAAEEGWTPASREALALLDEADRLAAEGRYDEATHMLLRRSIEQIEAALPGLIDPSSTAREISASSGLPPAARRAFAAIAERVERSLFALRRLGAADWRAAREAYAQFALPGGGGGGAR